MTSNSHTQRLLSAGMIAGPLFAVVAVAQVLVRDGFDLSRHPLSLLSLGQGGWIQIANFVLTGALVILFAIGLRAAMPAGPGRTWGPLLLAGHGVGLMVAGVFTADPSMGFPAGAPEGTPNSLSGHAIAHGVGFALAFLSFTAASIVLARRFNRIGQRHWATYTLATATIAVTLAGWPSQGGASIRYAIASVLTFTWLTLLAASTRAHSAATSTMPTRS
ncbi:MAG: DUF998 domain-containing protein [Nocardioides sp.]